MSRRRWRLALGATLLAGSLSAVADARSEWADGSGVDIELRSNLVYHSVSGQELKLDLFLPVNRSQQPLPLLVYVHGGGWIAGSKEIALLRLLPFLQMGWAAAAVQYRLAKVAPAPAAVEDLRCALYWLRERSPELRLDPARFVLAGGSAGGHLALIGAMLPEGSRLDRGCPLELAQRWRGAQRAPLRVAAVLNWFGISDLQAMLEGPQARGYAIEWFGSLPDEQRRALAREISPLHQVRPGLPPVLSFHGDADDVVPLAQSQQLHAALKAAGVTERLVVVPGAKHGLSRAQMVQAMQQVREFLQQQGLPVAPAATASAATN